MIFRSYVGDRDLGSGGRPVMRTRITAPGAGEHLTIPGMMTVMNVCIVGGGRRSLADRLGPGGVEAEDKDEVVVNKSVMSRVVKVGIK